MTSIGCYILKVAVLVENFYLKIFTQLWTGDSELGSDCDVSLGGGCKCCFLIVTPIMWKIPILTRIFFRWVETTNLTILRKRFSYRSPPIKRLWESWPLDDIHTSVSWKAFCPFPMPDPWDPCIFTYMNTIKINLNFM